MRDTFEKAVHFGMGLFSYSKEKVEDLVDEMVRRGELKKDEASEVVDDIVRKGEEQKERLNAHIDELIKQRCADYATKEDVRAIIREELRAALAEKDETKE